jgi:DNA repair ATPase RecN
VTLHSLHAEGYQSLRDVRIELGGLTVITGPTGSGKSALGRVLRLIANNARGTNYISHGMRTCKAGLAFHWNQDQPAAVGIERGGRGSDLYRLSVTQLGEPYTKEFTKLGGAVPEEISSILALGEINLGSADGQFERPFLLDATGGQAAKTLGQLTNVTLIFDAAREANRRRLELERDQKKADAEVARLTQEAQRFTGLRERISAVESAETALAALQGAQHQRARLSALLDTYDAAQAQKDAVSATIRDVPDPSLLEGLVERRDQLAFLISQYELSFNAAAVAAGKVAAADDAEVAATEELGTTLQQAGVCPTCNRPF